MESSQSVIQLAPASQAFVNKRATSLGTWVLSACLDCIFLGIVFCQVQHYFENSRKNGQYTSKMFTYVVLIACFLSVLKTIQSIAIIWEQNVMEFANPDYARTMFSACWWQVTAPLMTGITGAFVQSFYTYRFVKLSGKIIYALPIVGAIGLGLVGGCLSTYYISKADAKHKVTWLLIHLVSVFCADLFITIGTVWALYSRRTGMEQSSSLIRRLLRMVFEAAVFPAFIATVDLILTQTLGSKLLWHLLFNYSLGKLYVISLLYTINCIGDYRAERTSEGRISFGTSRTTGNIRVSRRGDLELGNRSYGENTGHLSQVQIHTQTITKLDDFSQQASGWEKDMDQVAQ